MKIKDVVEKVEATKIKSQKTFVKWCKSAKNRKDLLPFYFHHASEDDCEKLLKSTAFEFILNYFVRKSWQHQHHIRKCFNWNWKITHREECIINKIKCVFFYFFSIFKMKTPSIHKTNLRPHDSRQTRIKRTPNLKCVGTKLFNRWFIHL